MRHKRKTTPTMKTTRIILLASTWLAATAASAIAKDDTAPKPASRTEVIFFEPQNFTDATDTYNGGDKSRAAVLDQLKDYLQQRVPMYVPEGYTLKITITDVDLAGEFEPWRAGALRDVRIVKEIYPPRINLAFKLTNAEGETVKAGERVLRDLTFQMSASPASNNDPLRYEKAMIDEWLRTEFGRNLGNVKKS